MTRVVLGSASSGRRKVLRQAGIDPLVVVSGIDEDQVVASLSKDATPDQIVSALAAAKAVHVTERLAPAQAADTVVIGCDSMLYCDGHFRGKPASADDARRQWQAMAGRSGQLHTGHCLIRMRDGQRVYQHSETCITTVHFSSPTDDELDAYIRTGEPLAVAGGFTLDGLGGWFIEGVDGDPSCVIGISLPLIRRLLEDAGLSLVNVWGANPLN